MFDRYPIRLPQAADPSTPVHLNGQLLAPDIGGGCADYRICGDTIWFDAPIKTGDVIQFGNRSGNWIGYVRRQLRVGQVVGVRRAETTNLYQSATDWYNAAEASDPSTFARSETRCHDLFDVVIDRGDG